MQIKIYVDDTVKRLLKGGENLEAKPAIPQNILSTFDGVTSTTKAKNRCDHRESLGRKTIGKVASGRIIMKIKHGFKYGIPYSLYRQRVWNAILVLRHFLVVNIRFFKKNSIYRLSFRMKNHTILKDL